MDGQYKCGDFCRYLSTFRVERGSEFSHTSIVKPSGAYYIPAEEETQFFHLYKQAMLFNDDLHMTEKHRSISPILIDLDFRFELDDKNIKRQFTENHILHIIKAYVSALNELVEYSHADIYVMLKPYPVIDKGMVKDGIHIVIPNIVTKPVVQYMIRKTVLPHIKEILKDLEVKNNIEDIVDEAVIERNNWQMYGSTKPNCDKYKVTNIFSYDPTQDTLVATSLQEDDCGYVEALSIRNKFKETHVKIEKTQQVSEYELTLKKTRKMKMEGPAFQTNQNLRKNTVDNLDHIKKVIDLLDARRAESYIEWIRVGWCLRNIDHRLLDNWIEFSKKSPKFVEGECERMWSYMRDEGLGVGTLYMWAKVDNPTGFTELQKTDMSELVYRSTSETHHDIAKVVHFLYKYDFVCCSIKNNFWYEFRSHRWVSNDCGFGLRSKISTEVVREYSLAAANYNMRAASTEVEAEQQRLLDIAKKLNGIALKLKQSPFKDNIIKECREMFYVEKFEEKLDSRPHLIGFLNGVYDLQANEFREGRPDDYISLTTGINYVPLNLEHPCVRDIHRFLSQIFTKPHIKEYVLLLLASFINGSIKEERFHIWTGSGCFAADTPVLMYDGRSVPVQNVRIGDMLMGDDGTPRKVHDLYTGYSDMYRIRPYHGASFEVNGEHVLAVHNVRTNTIEKMIVREYMMRDGKKDMRLFRPSKVDFASAPTECSLDMIPHLGCIPEEFKVNDIATRRACLASIIDASGSFDVSGSVEFIRDVIWLARSLGVACFENEDCTRVSLKGRALYDIPVKNVLHDMVDPTEDMFIPFDIERVDDNYFYGFQLDGNHLFVLGDGHFIVQSNSNGKSKLIDLFESCIGDYSCKFPVTLLTQKRAASNAANTELARAKGRRFACLQEPAEDEKLNIGLMKELTGGDKIMARAIYREPIEFKPQFKMILTCNHLPNVPSDDGGTWRRLRVVEFTSKFTENPNPENPNEFPVDLEISGKFEDWKEHFMALLIQYHNRYLKEGIKEPEEVLKCTKEYQKNNDIILEFVESELEQHAQSFLIINEVMAQFKIWARDSAPNFKLNKKKDLVTGVSKTLGKHVIVNRIEGWKGWRFKIIADSFQDDLDN